jgi:hypothetical protein
VSKQLNGSHNHTEHTRAINGKDGDPTPRDGEHQREDQVQTPLLLLLLKKHSHGHNKENSSSIQNLKMSSNEQAQND